MAPTFASPGQTEARRLPTAKRQPATPTGLLGLQQLVGNRAVLRTLGAASDHTAQRRFDKATDGNGPVNDIPDSALSGRGAAAAVQALGYIDAGTALLAQPWVQARVTANGGKVPNSVKKIKWGLPHANRDGDLPGVKGAGGYLEYYLRTGDAEADTVADAARLVISASGEVFHTATHYGRDGAPAFTHYRAKT